MKHVTQSRPSATELKEIERLDAILTRLSRRADNGPHSLAHASLAAGFNAIRGL